MGAWDEFNRKYGMTDEDWKEWRDRLSKRKSRLSYEERERLRVKYHGLTIRCSICEKQGTLSFKVKGSESKRYFYCRHGDDACYVGRIEDIEELLNPPKETGKQATLGLTNSFAGDGNS